MASQKGIELYRQLKGERGKGGWFALAKEHEIPLVDIALIETCREYISHVKEEDSTGDRFFSTDFDGSRMNMLEYKINWMKANIIDLLAEREYFDDLKQMYPDVLELDRWKMYLDSKE